MCSIFSWWRCAKLSTRHQRRRSRDGLRLGLAGLNSADISVDGCISIASGSYLLGSWTLASFHILYNFSLQLDTMSCYLYHLVSDSSCTSLLVDRVPLTVRRHLVDTADKVCNHLHQDLLRIWLLDTMTCARNHRHLQSQLTDILVHAFRCRL